MNMVHSVGQVRKKVRLFLDAFLYFIHYFLQATTNKHQKCIQ